MDMHAAKLGTTAELREYLAGIKKTGGIKGAFQALLLISGPTH